MPSPGSVRRLGFLVVLRRTGALERGFVVRGFVVRCSAVAVRETGRLARAGRVVERDSGAAGSAAEAARRCGEAAAWRVGVSQ